MKQSGLRLSSGGAVEHVAGGSFRPYGQVLAGLDFTAADAYLNREAKMPAQGNVYEASVPCLESLPLAGQLAADPFGFSDIQLGYCNGHTHSLNALEWHKSSEVNYAATDMVLLLAPFSALKDGRLSSQAVRAFFLPRGTAVELYPRTLHFAPCAVSGDGFRCLVALPRGTNGPPAAGPVERPPLLRAVNKWMICHPQRAALVAAGVVPGIRGENIRVLFD